MTKNNSAHIKRVNSELVKAGFTKYGLLKGESRHLPNLIHKDERIGGAVYGRAEHGSAMIVATDKRVLYLDHKILFNKSEEISYDAVSGVSCNIQTSYAGVVLHTRLGDFELKFVNLKCARRFVKYVEGRRIEQPSQSVSEGVAGVNMPSFSIEDGRDPAQFSQKARNFLISHDLGVISTIDNKGNPRGSAVYYATDKNNYIFIVTKNKTFKAQNILKNPRVAMTIFDTNSLQTLQLSGVASVERDPEICKRVYHDILRPRFEGAYKKLPPIMYMPAGEYEVIVVKAIEYKFSDYKNNG